MPATNCTGNTPRKHQYAFSLSGTTVLSKRIAADSFGLQTRQSKIKVAGNNGSLWSRSSDYIENTKVVNGPVVHSPRPDELRWMLPLICGQAFATNTIKVGGLCPFFRAGHYDAHAGIDTVFLYKDCVTSKATFSSSDGAGGFLSLNWDIEARDSSQELAATWPAGMVLSSQQPFVHVQSVLTVDSVATRMKNATVTIDHRLILDQFFNAKIREDMPQDDPLITLGFESPFDAASDLALTNLTGSIAATLVYTNGPLSLSFSFPCLQYVERPAEPVIGAKGQRVMNQYTFEACLLDTDNPATDSPLVIVLDDTP